MVQRIQNLFLLIAGIAQVYLLSRLAFGALDYFLLLAATLFCFTAAFLYKKLSLQRVFAMIAFLLDLSFIVYLKLFRPGGAEMPAEKGLEWWCLMLFVAAVALILFALRSISKDIMLLKRSRGLR